MCTCTYVDLRIDISIFDWLKFKAWLGIKEKKRDSESSRGYVKGDKAVLHEAERKGDQWLL